MKRILALLIAVLLLTSCGKSPKIEQTNNNIQDVNDQSASTVSQDQEEDSLQEEGYCFQYNGVDILFNKKAVPLLEKLGEPLSYFEAPSCAFQGLDKVYYYGGFEVSTYPNENDDYISTVDIVDDSVTTAEGIYIGSSLEDVKAAYGNDYTEASGLYTYTKGNTKLAILIENDVVAAITYFAIMDE